MAVLIDMQIIGDSVAARAMVDSVLAKLSPAPLAGFLLGVVQPIVKNSTERAFITESDPKGNPWQELAPSTIIDRESQGYTAGPIQYRSGELYNYFQGAQGDINATLIATSLTWPGKAPAGEKIKYKVGSAQAGNRRTGAPPRPVLGLTLQDAEKIMMGLFEYVIGAEL